MKELVFNTGGRPLFNNDLQTLQGETFEALAGILRGLGRPLIVSGCRLVNISGDLYKIEPGLVFIDDKILKFDGFDGNGIIIGDNENDVTDYIVRDETITLVDRRTHKDGIEKETIIEERAILSQSKPSTASLRQSIPLVTSTFEVFWNAAFGKLTRFIDSIIQDDSGIELQPKLNTCILSGFRITDRTSGIIRHTGGLIYYNGEIYEINPSNENLLLSEPNDPNLALDTENPGKVKLVKNIDEGFILLSQIERFDTIRRNRAFPTGTVLHIKMTNEQLDDNFDKDGTGSSQVWRGWMIDPDSQGRVIVGHDGGKRNPNGSFKAGSNEETISKTNLPDHQHYISLRTQDDTHRHGVKGHTIRYGSGSNVVEALIFANRQENNLAQTEDDTHSHGIEGLSNPGSFANSPINNMQEYVVYLNVVKM